MPVTYEYEREVYHHDSGKSAVIKAHTQFELYEKQEEFLRKCDRQWKQALEKQAREQQKRSAEEKAQQAIHDTRKAEKAIHLLNTFLIHNLGVQEIDFEKLKKVDDYDVPMPQEPVDQYKEIPEEPKRTDERYFPHLSLFESLFKKKQIEEKNDEIFRRDHEEWEETLKKNTQENERIKSEYGTNLQQWLKDRVNYLAERDANNEQVEMFKEGFLKNEAAHVEKYYELLLERIELPFDFLLKAVTKYTTGTKILVIDLLMPSMSALPLIKKVSYIKTRDEFKLTKFSDKEQSAIYDSFLYQLVLVCLNRIFTINKKYNNIDAVILNGKVQTIDKKTGQNIEPFILTIQCNSSDFEILNLKQIDPKEWFKSMKGLAAPTLSDIRPVAPIDQTSREDSRFIEGYSVIEEINQGDNLAAMDWQDFENLIRDLFEKEFSENGGEVKITQASRDGGVDAVAFDPDPIRGGKIVIQAKRYTNVVGVSAVRDLFGTVEHEGAMKGILVTTSYFGTEAYDFAKGKPLTLIDGGKLLWLLEKHGHKARIDIEEAKMIRDQEKR